MTSKTTLLQTLAKKKSTLLFKLGQLTMMDRRDIVQKGLDTFGKKLSDSAFNNQVILACFFLLYTAQCFTFYIERNVLLSLGSIFSIFCFP